VTALRYIKINSYPMAFLRFEPSSRNGIYVDTDGSERPSLGWRLEFAEQMVREGTATELSAADVAQILEAIRIEAARPLGWHDLSRTGKRIWLHARRKERETA
jgi:hypothetical protein